MDLFQVTKPAIGEPNIVVNRVFMILKVVEFTNFNFAMYSLTPEPWSRVVSRRKLPVSV
jgi:hypothetical protein